MKLEVSRTISTFYFALNDSLEGYVSSGWIELNSTTFRTTGIEVLVERETDEAKLIKLRFDGFLYYFLVDKVDKGLKVYRSIFSLNSANTLALVVSAVQRWYSNEEFEIVTIDLENIKNSKLGAINTVRSKSIIPSLNNGQAIYVGTKSLLLKLEGRDVLIDDFRNSKDTTILTNTSRYQPSVLVNDSLIKVSDSLGINRAISSFYNTGVYTFIGKNQAKTYALYSQKSNKVFELDFSKEPLSELDNPFNYILYQNRNSFEDFIFLLNKKKLGVWYEGTYQDLIKLKESDRVEKVFRYGESVFVCVQDYTNEKVTLFSYSIKESLQLIKEVNLESNNKIDIKVRENFVALSSSNMSKLFIFENNNLVDIPKFWKGHLNCFWVSSNGQLFVEAFSENRKRYFYSSEGVSRKINDLDNGSLFWINKEIEAKGRDSNFTHEGQIINKRVYLKYNFQEGSISKLDLYPSDELFIRSIPKDTILFEGKTTLGEKYFYAISKDGVFQLNETPINSNYAQYKNGELFVFGNKKGEDPQLFLMSLADAKEIQPTYTTLAESELILSRLESSETPESIAFPNPFDDKLEIEIPEYFKPQKISLFDMTGRIVFELGNLSNINEIELNNLITHAFQKVRGGTYLIKLVGIDDIHTLKVVKN